MVFYIKKKKYSSKQINSLTVPFNTLKSIRRLLNQNDVTIKFIGPWNDSVGIHFHYNSTFLHYEGDGGSHFSTEIV